ncbi:MAG: 4-carboxymuconolactone decarboxylase [Minisyncoccia bacterium]|mgnify:FL=1|jgi:4-carboxymuconolactone decarboxylase
MARIKLLSTRDGLDPQQQKVFDWVVESRGKMIRPYEVLLHAPGLARPAAELGHQIRYEGQLSDHDRELAIITTAKVHDCEFEWSSHVGLAREAGVSDETIDYLDGDGADDQLIGVDELIVGFVRELCADSDVSDSRFAAAESAFGASGVVELTALVGYYTFLGFVMKVAEAC